MKFLRHVLALFSKRAAPRNRFGYLKERKKMKSTLTLACGMFFELVRSGVERKCIAASDEEITENRYTTIANTNPINSLITATFEARRSSFARYWFSFGHSWRLVIPISRQRGAVASPSRICFCQPYKKERKKK